MDSFIRKYEYNDLGLVSEITMPGGKKTKFYYTFYDESNERIKLIRKTTGDSRISYHYNERGLLIRMEDDYGAEEYSYNEFGLVNSIVRNGGQPIVYEYNLSGSITSLRAGNSYRIDYVYDFLDRLVEMNTPAGRIQYKYHTGDGIVERYLPNGIKTQYKYLPNGRVESISHAGSDNYLILRYTYKYSPDGLIKSIVEWTTQGEYSVAYGYDAAQRLVSFTDKNGSKTEYKYDDFGNRIESITNGVVSESYTYDGLGRMLTAKGKPCEYDNAGNLISFNEERNKFAYNIANQLEKVDNISYEYDGNGLLITRNNREGKTGFINNPLSETWQPLLARSDEKTEAFYIWQGSEPIALIENGKTQYFLTDNLSSVRGLTDENGKLTQQVNYTPFGLPDKNLSGNKLIPGFTGMIYEPEAKLYLAKSRAYTPNTGRFLQVDPVHQAPSGSQKEISVYNYCGSDPVNYIDRCGEQCKCPSPANNVNQQNPATTNKPWLNVRELTSIENWNAFINSFPKFYEKPGRDEIVQRLWESAFFDDKGKYDPEIHNAWLRANTLRNIYINNPNDFNKLFPNPATRPNANELRDVENSLLQQRNIELAELNKSSADALPKGFEYLRNLQDLEDRIFRGIFMGVGWALQHINVEYFGGYNPIFNRNTALHQTRSTWAMQGLGIFRGIIKARPAEISRVSYNFPVYPNRFSIIRQDDYKDNSYKYGKTFDYHSVFGGNQPPPPGGGASNIGGVYLGGAGNVFDGLGEICGVALDDKTGKLLLISNDKKGIDLPSLRIDDVVTIFKSVYQKGEAPFVSIDPDPQNPNGPVMKTRHGELTNDTYVGWVLFEADRIMKTYSLSEDNITKRPVHSKVLGYSGIVEKIFSGEKKDNIWNRFWIVPAKVEKSISSKKDITLVNVPLMVKTERMIMRNGKLESAPDGKLSDDAGKFAKWFTDNYSKIAEESYSLPPAGSGFTKPVPVFRELQRIATITALAEHLRNLGVEFPFWMRNFKVTKFHIPDTTPAHTVKRSKGDIIYSVYGGVRLAPADDKVITKSNSTQANQLKEKITSAFNAPSYFSPIEIKEKDKKYITAQMPGSNTKDLGAYSMRETDLSVLINNDYFLNLTRNYNSFISLEDKSYGGIWTFNLPFLEKQRIPIQRKGDSETFTHSYFLISPLNDFSERINDVYEVNNSVIGFKTIVVKQNNIDLHFNNDGYLVAYDDAPVTILYNRDKGNRIFQIVGFYGKKAMADIKIKYNSAGSIAEAVGSDGQKVEYLYSNQGLLKEVKLPDYNKSYDYQDNKVLKINIDGKTVNQFDYNKKGQLAGLKTGDNSFNEYRIEKTDKGYEYRTIRKNGGKEEVTEYVEYDNEFRPKYQKFGDGSSISADYSGREYDTYVFLSSNRKDLTINQSKDSRIINYLFPDGNKITHNYNNQGRLISSGYNNQTLVKQNWRADGKLATIFYPEKAVHYDYSPEGMLQRTLITPPVPQNQYSEWVSYEYDDFGRLRNIRDFSGRDEKYNYNRNGDVAQVSSRERRIDFIGDNGLVEKIVSADGEYYSFNYDEDKIIKEITHTNQGASRKLKYEEGKLSRFEDFNGSTYSFVYGPDQGERLIKIVSPFVETEYKYDNTGNVTEIICNDKYRNKYIYDNDGRIKEIRISFGK